MGFIDASLVPGEWIVYRTRLHWIIFRWVALLALLAVPAARLISNDIGLIFLVTAGIALVPSLIKFVSSEFGVTNKRVLIKTGFISRHSLEILLEKVEGIGVDQGILGRTLGFGSIVITGTGGTRERFDTIFAPLEFRRQVQAQLRSSAHSAFGKPRIDLMVEREENSSGEERYRVVAYDEERREVVVAVDLDMRRALRECVHLVKRYSPGSDIYVLITDDSVLG